MKQIPIYYKKKVVSHAQVSDKDFKYLNQWRWRLSKSKKSTLQYAYTDRYDICPVITVCMHRIVLERKLNRQLISKEYTDHKDHDGLNNQRRNVRLATSSQNQMNQRISKNNTSGYIGVYWHKKHKKWQSQIMVDRKQMFLGRFINKEDAVKAYVKAAKKAHKQFYCER